MSQNYKFNYPEGLYFVSFAVVQWLDTSEIPCDAIARQRGLRGTGIGFVNPYVGMIFLIGFARIHTTYIKSLPFLMSISPIIKNEARNEDP